MNLNPILNPRYGIWEPRIIVNPGPNMPTEHADGSPIRVGDYSITVQGKLLIAAGTPYDDYRTEIVWEKAGPFDLEDVITELRTKKKDYMAEFVKDCNP